MLKLVTESLILKDFEINIIEKRRKYSKIKNNQI